MTLEMFIYWLMIPIGVFVALCGTTDRIHDFMASPTKRRIRIRLALEIFGAIIFLLGCVLFAVSAISRDLYILNAQ